MLYALSKREIAKIRSAGFAGEFTGAEILFAIYKTDADVVKKILPKPLKPAPEPLVTAFVAHYPETNFSCGYNEGAVLIHATLGRQTGVYCVSMPVDDDMAMIYGREIYGYPKKIADNISLERTESKITGSVRRKGVEIIRIELEQQKPLALSELSRVWNQSTEQKGRTCQEGISFLYKYFLSPDGKGFDYIPRLVQETIQFRPRTDLVTGKGLVNVQSSSYDPLGDIPVRSVFPAYTVHGIIRCCPAKLFPEHGMFLAFCLILFAEPIWRRYCSVMIRSRQHPVNNNKLYLSRRRTMIPTNMRLISRSRRRLSS